MNQRYGIWQKASFLGVDQNTPGTMKAYRHPAWRLDRFGNQLRKIRKSKGLTQEQLANLAELEISQISRIERGVISTSTSQLFQIAAALKVHPKVLFDTSTSSAQVSISNLSKALKQKSPSAPAEYQAQSTSFTHSLIRSSTHSS